MNQPISYGQKGAVLTLEAAILMIIFAISAIGFGVILGKHLPAIINSWLSKIELASS